MTERTDAERIRELEQENVELRVRLDAAEQTAEYVTVLLENVLKDTKHLVAAHEAARVAMLAVRAQRGHSEDFKL